MVYVLKINNYIKVGSTTDLKQRLNAYNTHNPYTPIILRELYDCGQEDEFALHNELKDYLVKGEWFEYNPQTEAIINNYTVKYPEKSVAKPYIVNGNALLIFTYLQKLAKADVVHLSTELRTKLAEDLNLNKSNVSRYLKILLDNKFIEGGRGKYKILVK